MIQLSEERNPQYFNQKANTRVLAAILKDPSLISKYHITSDDFSNGLHKLVFATISNLEASGAKEIGVVEIEEYLAHYTVQFEIYKKKGGNEFVEKLMNAEIADNIEYYCTQVKKYSLLRGFYTHGIDISEYINPAEIDPKVQEKMRERLDDESVSDIINHFRGIQLEVTAPFRVHENQEVRKAGVGGIELLESWKKDIAWGIGYSSGYLTEVTHGMRRRMFTVKSAGTGVGKTRTALADIAYACSPQYWDPKNQQWANNPNGMHNGALYIGTEMELEELDSILWAYIADVPQDHIKYNAYRHGEEERVRKAIKLLQKDANIHIAYLPSFTIGALQDVIEEHVIKYGVEYVFFDYMHSTPELIAEFSKRSRTKMQTREDQVLLDLATQLKQIARDMDICLNSATQLNGDFRDEKRRDQTLIAGSKAIANKADHAMIAMPPTRSESELVESFVKNYSHGLVPNLVYSVYKVRDSKYKDVKIWLSVDYSTMRTHDCFVTDYNYVIQPDVEKAYIDRYSGKMIAREKPIFLATEKREAPTTAEITEAINTLEEIEVAETPETEEVEEVEEVVVVGEDEPLKTKIKSTEMYTGIQSDGETKAQGSSESGTG